MLVTKSNFDKALLELVKHPALGYDTETTCLSWWDNPWLDSIGVKPRVFSMQFATPDQEFYFDFNHSSDRLNDSHFQKIHAELTNNPEKLWFIANAKFDLHHSANHGVFFAGEVHCTAAIARVVNNLEPSLKLDDLGEKYLQAGKLDVITLLKERGHSTKLKKFGYNDKYDDILHFDRLELGELVEYGKRDTRLCFDLGMFQTKKILELDREIYEQLPCRLSNVLYNERAITKVLFDMEREGVLIDRDYTEKAYEFEVAEYRRIESELDRLSKSHCENKIDWNSAKQLKPLFDALNEPYSYTEKGNASFDKDALEDSDSEVAKLILRYRFHYKRAHTYFENFIWLSDRNNVLHADAQQAGTGYGRMSYWSPNLQNVPKASDKEETGTKVRRCFIPKPGTLLADVDYKGAEYYMSMDYAREMTVVEELKAGLDPHQRLANEMDIPSRHAAKTMQFRILYGGGGMAVGRALGYKGLEADRIGKAKKKLYFQRVPALAALIRQVSGVASSRGYIFNWLGRLLKYDSQTGYKAFNGLIQSGVGDMTKKAMVEIAENILPGHKSKMLIQVHDALLFKLYPDELHLVPKIKAAMTGVYPHKVLPMQADAGFSTVSWSDLHSEIPTVT
jgi:DNA polymerase I-like protein with 3'-5' exonuclease and polymerase domains